METKAERLRLSSAEPSSASSVRGALPISGLVRRRRPSRTGQRACYHHAHLSTEPRWVPLAQPSSLLLYPEDRQTEA